jgi:hypothetical protein
MDRKTFVVRLWTDEPNKIDSSIVHLALMYYFVAFVGIDVEEVTSNTSTGQEENLPPTS